MPDIHQNMLYNILKRSRPVITIPGTPYSLLIIMMLSISIKTQATIPSNFNQVIPDKVYKESIKTVQFHRAGWELTWPVMELNGIDRVELSFDDLSEEIKNYSYTIIHCNAIWVPTPLPTEEYLTGFPANQFYDYKLSFNTYHKYVHYSLTIPNEDAGILLSGNYILKVFENADEEQVVMTKRFAVAEPVVSIRAEVNRPVVGLYRDSGQEVDVFINYGNLTLNDPYSEIHLAICQNNRWELAITELKPLFFKDGILEYNYQKENIFTGGNEYRYFDIKSLRFHSENIKNIEFVNPYYHVELMPEESRSGLPYFFREDLDGRFFIDVQEAVNRNTEADYVYVHFTLNWDAPIPGSGIYVSGAMTNWAFDETNRMEYNLERKAYELTLLLKQGYYNYEYVVIPDGTHLVDPAFIEGNHYETENDYVIYVYYHPIQSRYDRLIGYQIINSLHKSD